MDKDNATLYAALAKALSEKHHPVFFELIQNMKIQSPRKVKGPVNVLNIAGTPPEHVNGIPGILVIK
jgi:hypothetical protein